MQRPATRVLAVLELLQTHSRMTGADLAARLEVDRRTLRRYISMLQELGIPIMTERGRFGHYSLIAGFKLPPMMFTDDEALAVCVGLLAARGFGLTEAAPAVASAQAKLERVMPAPLRQRVDAVRHAVALDLPASSGAPHSNRFLLALSAAAKTRRRVRLSYAGQDGPVTTRDFDTYGLAYRGGAWYAVGHCRLRQALRSFRLDRIQEVELLDGEFSKPDDFDVIGYLTNALAILPRARAASVLLATTLAEAQSEIPATFGTLTADARGVLLSSHVHDLGWLARELSRLPFAFEVQEPLELKAAVQALAERLVRASR